MYIYPSVYYTRIFPILSLLPDIYRHLYISNQTLPHNTVLFLHKTLVDSVSWLYWFHWVFCLTGFHWYSHIGIPQSSSRPGKSKQVKYWILRGLQGRVSKSFFWVVVIVSRRFVNREPVPSAVEEQGGVECVWLKGPETTYHDGAIYKNTPDLNSPFQFKKEI